MLEIFIFFTSRKNFIKSYTVSINRFDSKHTFKNWSSFSVCSKCRHKHHSLLHFEKASDTHLPSLSAIPSNSLPINTSDNPKEVTSLASSTSTQTKILLYTALIKVLDDAQNKFQTVRCIFDPGSQTICITEKYCNRLGLYFLTFSRAWCFFFP